MLLDSLILGQPVAASVIAAASPNRVGDTLHARTTEPLAGSEAHWTFALRRDRLVELDLYVGGNFDALAPLYDALATTLRARHGAPTDAPPNDDEARHVELLAEGLPDDRSARLRSLEWSTATERVALSLYLTWPANIQLRMRAEQR